MDYTEYRFFAAQFADLRQRLIKLEEHIAMNQSEMTQALTTLGAQLGAVSTELDKVSGETATLLAANADLKTQLDAAIAAGGTITPELQAAVDAVIAQGQVVADKVKAVDDQVPDAVPTP